MYWIWFALASVILLSVANILQRLLMRDADSDPVLYALAFQFVAAVVTFGIAVSRGFAMPPIRTYPLNFALMAVFYGFGTVLFLRALKILDVSTVVILSSVRSIITIVSAVVFLGESFSIVQGVGALLILCSVAMVSLVRRERLDRTGIGLTIGMAACFGLAVTNDKFILSYPQDTLSYTAISFFFPGTILAFSYPSILPRIRTFVNPLLAGKMLLMGTVYGLAAVAFFAAMNAGANASQLGPVNQASVVLTVLLSAILLKERESLAKKVLAAVIVTTGVMLLR